MKIDKNFDMDGVKEAYLKMIKENEEKEPLTEGKFLTKVRAMTKTFMEVRRDALQAQKDLDKWAEEAMDILTDDKEDARLKLQKMENIRDKANKAGKKARPTLKKLYWDLVDQLDSSVNMYKEFINYKYGE